jgi:hypothetical protein
MSYLNGILLKSTKFLLFVCVALFAWQVRAQSVKINVTPVSNMSSTTTMTTTTTTTTTENPDNGTIIAARKNRNQNHHYQMIESFDDYKVGIRNLA